MSFGSMGPERRLVFGKKGTESGSVIQLPVTMEKLGDQSFKSELRRSNDESVNKMLDYVDNIMTNQNAGNGTPQDETRLVELLGHINSALRTQSDRITT